MGRFFCGNSRQPSVSPSLVPVSQTPWDVNGDGVVNVQDLTLVANGFGQDSPDVNSDGVVNILDLTIVASHLSEEVK